ASARDDQDPGRENDDVYGEREQSGMPDESQQAGAVGYSAQRDRDEPCADQHERDGRDVDAKHVNLNEAHAAAPVSKYERCSERGSEMTRIRARTRSANAVSASASRARRLSSSLSRSIAIALFPCANVSSVVSSSGPVPKRGAIWRS